MIQKRERKLFNKQEINEYDSSKQIANYAIVEVQATIDVNIDNYKYHYLSDEFHQKYITGILSIIKPVLTTVITSLLKSLDFLGYQLDHALGNISDDVFAEVSKKYLIPPQSINKDDLKRQITILQLASSIDYDTEIIAEIFNCDVDQAEDALISSVKDKMRVTDA